MRARACRASGGSVPRVPPGAQEEWRESPLPKPVMRCSTTTEVFGPAGNTAPALVADDFARWAVERHQALAPRTPAPPGASMRMASSRVFHAGGPSCPRNPAAAPPRAFSSARRWRRRPPPGLAAGQQKQKQGKAGEMGAASSLAIALSLFRQPLPVLFLLPLPSLIARRGPGGRFLTPPYPSSLKSYLLHPWSRNRRRQHIRAHAARPIVAQIRCAPPGRR